MNIYFSGSIRGGREHDDYYSFIVGELKEFGEVLSEFVGDKSLTSYGTLNMTDEEIYSRDVSMIEKSDIFIADISVPSLGVGYEIAYAEKLGKKIYCIYLKKEDSKVSAMIAGCPNCKVFSYENKEDIFKIIKSIFEK